MTESQKESTPLTDTALSGRRQFLKGVALATAAGAAASAGVAVAGSEPVTLAQPETAEGYHETDHIRAYYASCR